MKRLSARAYLLGLTAAAALPVWAFAAYLLLSFASEKQHGYGERAIQLAQHASLIVDDKLRDIAVLIDSLSRSDAMATGDLRKLHAQASQIVQGTGQTVVLRDFANELLLDSDAVFGSVLPAGAPLAGEDMAELRTGRLRVSNVFLHPQSGEPRIAVQRKVRVGTTEAILEISIPAELLADVLAPAVPPDWIVGVGDRQGVYVARSQRNQEVSGRRGVADYLAKAVGPSGTFTATNQFGDTLLAGYTHSPLSGWLFAANVPLAVVAAPFWNSLYLVLALAAIALSLSFFLSYSVGRILTHETSQLAERAGLLSNGVALAPLKTRLAEFAVVDEAFTTARRKIRARTSELEAVLETAPVAVWFTYDPIGRQVIRNRFAAELMGVPAESRGTFSDPVTVVDTTALKDGKLVTRQDRPLTRAMRGEFTDHEEYAYRLADGSERSLLTSARPIYNEEGAIVGAVQVSLDISERKRGEEQRRLLASELAHRVKNNLAIVQSLAHRTIQNSDTLEEAATALSARLSALASAHDVLNRNDFRMAELRDIVQTSVVTHAAAERVTVSGPNVALPPDQVMSVTLSLHELLTNAQKYGALSTDSGRISVEWDVADNVLSIVWHETGGPEVSPPAKAGFGTMLIQRSTQSAGGKAEMSFSAKGFRCLLTYPVLGAAASAIQTREQGLA
jgi:two-component sensor histidine kinase/PAS domain-containing protein